MQGASRQKGLPAGLLLQFGCFKFCASRNYSLLARGYGITKMHKNLHLPRTQRFWKFSIVQGMQYATHPHQFTQSRRRGNSAPTAAFSERRMMAEARTAYSTPGGSRMFQSLAVNSKDSSPFQALFCVDLHVHSCHSTCPSQWILQKVMTEKKLHPPRKIYDIARARGMNYVTITDHDTISSALEIAHLPQVFISEEISAFFPDDKCEVHVLAWNITEAQHREISRLRLCIFELVPYLMGQGIAHACAHPLCAANNRLNIEHVEQLILLFSVFELNGARNNVQNEALRKIVSLQPPNP